MTGSFVDYKGLLRRQPIRALWLIWSCMRGLLLLTLLSSACWEAHTREDGAPDAAGDGDRHHDTADAQRSPDASDDLDEGALPASDASTKDSDAGVEDSGADDSVDAEPEYARVVDEVLERTEAIGDTPVLVFIASLFEREEIWGLDANGTLTLINEANLDPPYTTSCGYDWTTLGYDGGRIRGLSFTPDGKALVWSERLSCNRFTDTTKSRVLFHDFETGTTLVLLESNMQIEMFGSGQTRILIAFGDESIRAFELVDGVLEAIRIAKAPVVQLDFPGGYVLPFSDRELLFADGLPPLEKVDGEWRNSELGARLGGIMLSGAASSASGKHVCAIARGVLPDGRLGERKALVLSEENGWISQKLSEDRPVLLCWISPDDKVFAFGENFYALEEDTLKLLAFNADNLRIYRTFRGALCGLRGQDIVSIDWSTLEVTTLLEYGALPNVCSQPEGGWPVVPTPGDDRSVVLIKTNCGCADCDISGTLSWNIDTGEIAVVEEADGEHDVYGYAFLPDGSAVVLSTQDFVWDDFQSSVAPATFFYISAHGEVETIGPLDQLDGPLHSPISYPLSRSTGVFF